MKTKMKSVVLLMAVLLVAAGIAGCKKKREKPTSVPQQALKSVLSLLNKPPAL